MTIKLTIFMEIHTGERYNQKVKTEDLNSKQEFITLCEEVGIL